MQTQSMTRTVRGLAIALVAVQMIDVIIHAATNQLEPIRVLSNMLIILWLALAVSGRFAARFQQTAVGFVGVYILLNAYFLVTQGLTNPTSGQPRTALLVLVALTVAISTVWTNLSLKKP